jgi:MoxR-like ATPase
VVQQLVDLVQAGDVVAGRVAVPGDLHQELAPDRLNHPLDLASARRLGAL